MTSFYSNNHNQILWQCRRGMLELDVILINFFHKHYAHLNQVMQVNFIKLLQESDTKLFSYFFTNELPDCHELQKLVLMINNRGL